MRGLCSCAALISAVLIFAPACDSDADKPKTGRAPEMDSACADSDTTDKPEARWTRPEDGYIAAECDEIFVEWGKQEADGTRVEGQRSLWCCKASN